MIDVVLVEPEIPGNTGNVIRLCANTGARLHLVKPLGFTLADREMKRAGLDYHEYASIRVHDHWLACAAALEGRRLFAMTTKAKQLVSAASFQADDVFLFGPETRGLSPEILQSLGPERMLRLPMRAGSRSLNLSNAVAVVVYEAWRQMGFEGGV